MTDKIQEEIKEQVEAIDQKKEVNNTASSEITYSISDPDHPTYQSVVEVSISFKIRFDANDKHVFETMGWLIPEHSAGENWCCPYRFSPRRFGRHLIPKMLSNLGRFPT